MPCHPPYATNRLLVTLLFGLLITLAGCRGRPAPTPEAEPLATAGAALPLATEAASLTRAPGLRTIATIAPTDDTGGAGSDPAQTVFRYEVRLRPVNAAGAPETVIEGQYRAGSWQQQTQTGNAAEQEAVMVEGVTYTRPAGEEEWTRWPGVGFDAAYGLTSPFTVLRLYAHAEPATEREADPLSGAAETTYRTQTTIPGEAVAEVLKEGVNAVAPDTATQETLLAQVAPMAVPQTITYWTGESGRIYQAAGTLLVANADGQLEPWMEASWRFWDYDAAQIAITAPEQYVDAPAGELSDPAATPDSAAQEPPELATLVVRVFAAPEVPAEKLAVTVYPAGDTSQPIDWRTDTEARFSLPPGQYDVLVQMNYAEEWLRGLVLSGVETAERDVVFDFGTLELTVLQGGEAAAVDIVTYPAGNRDNWVDWRSENPARMQLRAGVYDVEIAYADYARTETVTGLEVRAGETTTHTVTLEP